MSEDNSKLVAAIELAASGRRDKSSILAQCDLRPVDFARLLRSNPELRVQWYGALGEPVPEKKERKPYTKREAEPDPEPEEITDADVLAHVVNALASASDERARTRILSAAIAFYENDPPVEATA